MEDRRLGLGAALAFVLGRGTAVTRAHRLALAAGAAAILANAAPAHALVVGAYRILPLPHFYERTERLPPGGGDGPLYYYGGAGFSHIKLLTGRWGGGVGAGTGGGNPPLSSDRKSTPL